MQRLTFPFAPDGLRVPALVSLESAEAQKLLAQGLPFPVPLHVRGLLDSGTTVTAVVPSVLRRLGALSGRTTSSQTAAGLASLAVYRISFSIYDPAAPAGSNLSRDTWTVTDLPQDLPDVDILFGLDILRELTLTVRGPAQNFTLEF